MSIINEKLSECILSNPLALDEIIPHLFLGNIYVGTDYRVLKKFNITHIVRIVENSELLIDYDGIKYETYELDDYPDVDIKEIFNKVNISIRTSRKKKENVLVHCVMGISRSPTVIIAYLIDKQKMSLRHAVKLVQDKRPCIFPNEGFIEQLKLYEKQIQRRRR
jgi:protein-tyrosine phosphatase